MRGSLPKTPTAGVIFSDDISMEAASVAGGVVERAQAALGAGCDVVLVCNDPRAAGRALEGLEYAMPAVSLARLARMHGRQHADDMVRLRQDASYVDALRAMAGIGARTGDLPLA